jgi:queuosine precursor transporter
MTVEQPQYDPSRRERVFLVLAGIFLANAILGELIGGKLFTTAGYVISIGVIPWPVVFITTDLVNEYYGPNAVRRLTALALALILYVFLLLFICMQVPAAAISPVDDAAFRMVFGQSMWIIAGSLIAFAISQLLDSMIFVLARKYTEGRLLWLRAVGSTVISQLLDTFVINSIAFGMSGQLGAGEVVELSFTNYTYKFLVALATLPLIYLGHGLIDRYFRSHAVPE